MEIELNRKKTEMWNFIRQNRNCIMDVNNDFKCNICKQVLINAQYSECSCTFCKDCLLEHMKSSNQCLGNNCDAYDLNIDINVHEDTRKNAQIRKLKCKCPTLNCNSEMSLEKLFEHVKLCSFKKCPFVTLGCNFEETSQLNIENHITTSSLNHNKLIVDLINNFENKITILQSNYRNIEDENKVLRDEVNEFRNIKDEIEKLKQSHYTDIERVKEENCQYIDLIKNDFETKLNELESKLDLDKDEVEQLKKENFDKVIMIKKIEKDNECLRNELENLKKESEDKSKKLENQKAELKKEFIININKTEERFKKENEKFKEFEQKLNKYENENKNKEHSIQEINKNMKDKCDVKLLEEIKNEIRQSPISFYVWRVDNIIQKREDAKHDKSKEIIRSNPFFTKVSGYKLRLSMYPNGLGPGLNTHLRLGLQIMLSVHDEILTWPYTETIKYSLMNTRTKTPYVSDTFSFKEEFRYIYVQPTEEYNKSLGPAQFVSWTDLLDDTKNLIKDGSIYIKVDLE